MCVESKSPSTAIETAEQAVDKLARLRKSRNHWKDKAVARASQIREIRKKINRIEQELRKFTKHESLPPGD
jgi:uncharacterized coiled-coil DUF342 family protein